MEMILRALIMERHVQMGREDSLPLHFQVFLHFLKQSSIYFSIPPFLLFLLLLFSFILASFPTCFPSSGRVCSLLPTAFSKDDDDEEGEEKAIQKWGSAVRISESVILRCQIITLIALKLEMRLPNGGFPPFNHCVFPSFPLSCLREIAGLCVHVRARVCVYVCVHCVYVCAYLYLCVRCHSSLLMLARKCVTSVELNMIF